MTAFPFELMIALMHMIGEGVFARARPERQPLVQSENVGPAERIGLFGRGRDGDGVA